MNKFLLLYLLVVTCCISSVLAQDKRVDSQVMVDKLGFNTYTATTVPQGFLQLDTELSYFKNKGRYVYTTSAQLPKLNLRYGITNSFELNVGAALSYFNTRFTSTKRTCLFCQWQYSRDFVTAGFRTTLFRYREGEGLLTLIGETVIPGTISEGGRSTFRLPAIRLANSDRLSQDWGYTLNAGTGLEYEGALFDFLEVSAATTYYVEEESILFLSASHRRPFHASKPSATFADAGFLQTLGKQFQIQAAVGLGLSRNLATNDFSGKIGALWRPLLFK